MALDTYANLQTSIANWLMRSGDANITAIAPDLITLFEEEARDRLKSRFAEASATLTASGATLALPSDFWEAREVKLTDANGMIATLDYMPPAQMDAEFGDEEPDVPRHFTIEGSNLRLAPVPAGTYSLSLLYQQGIPALSNSNTTNWLLTHYPSVYLYGSLVHAAPFIGEDERIVTWRTLTEAAFERIAEADIKARWGGGPLVMRLDLFATRAGIAASTGGGTFTLDQSLLDGPDTLS